MRLVTYFLILVASLCRLSCADIANLYFERGEYAAATEYFERLFIENSCQEYPEEHLSLARCYFQLEEYNRAEKVIERTLGMLVKPKHKTECLLMLGIIEYERSEYDEAAAVFKEAQCLQTDRLAEILLWLGKSEYKRKNYLKAMESLGAARTLHDIPELFYWYGLTLLRLGKYEEAHSTFSSLPPSKQWKLRSLLFKGYTLHLMRSDEEARKEFESIATSSHSSEDSPVVGIAHLNLGCIAMRENEYEKAIEHLTIAKDVASPEISDNALFRIGWSHYRQSEWIEARETFRILVSRRPEGKFWQSACYYMGEAEYRRKRYSQALELFDELLRKTPDSRYASYSLYASAYCYYHMASLSKAIQQFEEYADRYPESSFLPHVRYRIGISAYRMRDYSKAIKNLGPLTLGESRLLSNEALYLMALSYCGLSDYDSALDQLNRLNEKEKPLRTEAQKLLGDILFQEGEYWRAIEAYKKLSEGTSGEQVPSEIIDEGRYQIERSLLRLGLYTSPVTMLKVYVRKYPESSKTPELQMELAQYYLETEEYYKAIKEFERLLELSSGKPEEAEATVGLARTHEKLGFLKKAREEFLRVNEESSLAPRAWFNAANISLQLGEMGRAISECQNVIEKFEKTPYAEQALYMQGECFMDLQSYEEAKVVYDKLIVEYPESSKREVFRFRLALLVLEEGLIEDGLQMLDTTWSSDSLSGEALFQTGIVLSELGQYQDAISKLLKASEYFSLDRKAEVLFKAGEVLELVGESSHAYQRYLDALDVVVNEKLRKKILLKIEDLRFYLEPEDHK